MAVKTGLYLFFMVIIIQTICSVEGFFSRCQECPCLNDTILSELEGTWYEVETQIAPMALTCGSVKLTKTSNTSASVVLSRTRQGTSPGIATMVYANLICNQGKTLQLEKGAWIFSVKDNVCILDLKESYIVVQLCNDIFPIAIKTYSVYSKTNSNLSEADKNAARAAIKNTSQRNVSMYSINRAKCQQ